MNKERYHSICWWAPLVGARSLHQTIKISLGLNLDWVMCNMCNGFRCPIIIIFLSYGPDWNSFACWSWPLGHLPNLTVFPLSHVEALYSKDYSLQLCPVFLSSGSLWFSWLPPLVGVSDPCTWKTEHTTAELDLYCLPVTKSVVRFNHSINQKYLYSILISKVMQCSVLLGVKKMFLGIDKSYVSIYNWWH